MKKYFLEVVVFICGAVLMIMEIVGSRVLSPFMGNSIVVWTSLIGVILGSLSLGYFLGGRVADKKKEPKFLVYIILGAAIFVGIVPFIDSYVLGPVGRFWDLRLASLLGALSLFAIPSILLGMVSPYAVKLRLERLKESGQTVGNLYAISTIGSIVGTFLSGFYLISAFGNKNILIILSLTLLITTFFLVPKKITGGLIVLIILAAAFLLPVKTRLYLASKNIIKDTDSQYNRIQLVKEDHTSNPMLILETGYDEYQSVMYLNSDELVWGYENYYHLADFFNPKIKNALVLGGGAYSYPRDFLGHHPDSKLDVVEIDPKMTQIAKEYFRLKEDKNLTIYHQDGRTFLNNNKKKYDAIYMDAFHAIAPYYLTTKETAQNIKNKLTDNGVVLLNIWSSLEGKNDKFLTSEYQTYKSVFSQVFVFPTVSHIKNTKVQNIVLIALKSDRKPNLTNTNREYTLCLKSLYKNEIKADTPILTDDYAPIDQYYAETLN